MKLVIISDTHSLHKTKEMVQIPDGDVLIHCGDVSNAGYEQEILGFIKWFSAQPHEHKVFIAGNHDFGLQLKSQAVTDAIKEAEERGVVYLEDSGVEIGGLKFWGSPWTPTFFDWAFMKNRGDESDCIGQVWQQVPDDTQVLITHGPPRLMNNLDYTTYGHINVGCDDLMIRVNQLQDLRLNCFGHIHGGYGVREIDGKNFVNASTCTEKYYPTNEPIIVEL